MATYVDSDDVDSYVADRPDSAAWTGATTAEKADALIYSSKIIDSLLFIGKKYETDISVQPLQWPRLVKTRHGWRIADLDSSDEPCVPQAIKNACCEEIIARLDTTNAKRQKLQAGGVKSFKISEISETFDGTLKGGGVQCTPLVSWMAYRFLEPYLAKGAKSI